MKILPTSKKLVISLLAFGAVVLAVSQVKAQEASNTAAPQPVTVQETTPVKPTPTPKTEVSLIGENAEQLVLTAIPPRLGDDNSLRGNPGEKIQTTIKVKNTSKKPVRIYSTPLDFMIGEDGKTPIPINVADDRSNRWSLASWITLVPNTQVIQPSETKPVSVVIEIPKDALPGGHYAMITHQPTFDLNVTENGAAPTEPNTIAGVNQRVGTLIYLIVNGDINEEAMIRQFTFPSFSELGPIPFSFTIENMSDIHIRPAMNVEIKNIFGKTVANIPVDTKNIFPLTSKEFQGVWNQIWGYGRYTAVLTVAYGTQGKVAIATTHFWFFPATLVIATVVVILTLIAMFIAIRRHLIHRKESEAARIAELEKQLADLEGKETQDN